MALNISIPPIGARFVDPATGELTLQGSQWYQELVEGIAAEFGAIEAAQAAQAAAVAAQAAADTAQAAADAAQATADAIVVPPNGSRTVTASGGISGTDYILLADATSGAFTLTLPSASLGDGPFIVKKTDATPNAVNIAVGGGDSINGGGGPIAITVAYEQRTCASDTVNAWYVS